MARTETKDRRRGERVTLWSPVQLCGADGSAPAALKNLSVAGLCCTTSRAFPELALVKIVVDLPGAGEEGERLRLELDGAVVRSCSCATAPASAASRSRSTSPISPRRRASRWPIWCSAASPEPAAHHASDPGEIVADRDGAEPGREQLIARDSRLPGPHLEREEAARREPRAGLLDQPPAERRGASRPRASARASARSAGFADRGAASRPARRRADWRRHRRAPRAAARSARADRRAAPSPRVLRRAPPRCAARTRLQAPRRRSRATRRRRWQLESASVIATAPLPVPTSHQSPRGPAASAASTRCSVSGRGTSTPGPTSKRRP